jgi:hypothetical protein
VTSLADIKRLASEAAQCMRAAREAPSHEDAVVNAAKAVNLRAEADDLLRDNPIRVEHPIFGAGLLQGLNESGQAMVLFDGDGHSGTWSAETADLDLLEEGV